MRDPVAPTAGHPWPGSALRGGLMVAALALVTVVVTAMAPVAVAAPPVVRQDAPSGPDLETRLARVERVVGGQGLLDLLSQVERLNREVKQLRGELESQGHTLGQVQLDKRRLEAEVATLKAGLAGMAPGLAVGGVPGGILPGAAAAVDAPSAPVVGDAPAIPAAAPITAPPAEAPSVPLPPAQALAGPAELPRPVSPDLPVPEPVVPADAPVGPAVAAVAPTPASPDEAAAYREAFSLLKAGEYDQAIAGFEAYLANFPTGPNADNAQYWLGEAHHVNRRFEPAIAHYRQLVANFPQSAKLTHARLKIGDCLYELGRREEAEQELKALVAEHPTSTAARLAEERLERWRLTRG